MRKKLVHSVYTSMQVTKKPIFRIFRRVFDDNGFVKRIKIANTFEHSLPYSAWKALSTGLLIGIVIFTCREIIEAKACNTYFACGYTSRHFYTSGVVPNIILYVHTIVGRNALCEVCDKGRKQKWNIYHFLMYFLKVVS